MKEQPKLPVICLFSSYFSIDIIGIIFIDIYLTCQIIWFSLILQLEDLHPLLVKKLSQKRDLLSCVTGFWEVPDFILSISNLPTSQAAQCSCILSQGQGWVSNLQVLVTWHSVDLCWSCGGGSYHAVSGDSLSHKSTRKITLALGVYCRAQQRANTNVFCPKLVSLLLC